MMWHSLASSMLILSVTCTVCVPVHSDGSSRKDRMTSQSYTQEPHAVISSSSSSSDVSLNEQFANYIEKVSFFEAQNRKLGEELEALKSTEGKRVDDIKALFEAELQKVRGERDDFSKENSKLEVATQSLRDHNAELFRESEKAKKWREEDNTEINKLNQKITELESLSAMLRRDHDILVKDGKRDLALNADLTAQLEKLKTDLQNTAVQYQDSENRLKDVPEEMEFLKSVHEQELKELQALAYRDTTAENREFWKNELSQAIRDIQNEYDSSVEQIRKDMETFYNEKIKTFVMNQEKLLRNMEEEKQRLIQQVTQLKDELQKLKAETEPMPAEQP